MQPDASLSRVDGSMHLVEDRVEYTDGVTEKALCTRHQDRGWRGTRRILKSNKHEVKSKL